MRLGGHRGWKARFPENTLEGFRAVAAHVDFVEIDIRWTSDGVAVLSHDPDVKGVTVAERTFEELRSAPDTASVPTFGELLAALPGLPLDIELKHDPTEPGFDPTMRRPLEIAALARPIDFVSSFHWPTLAAVKEAFPHVETGVLVEHPESVASAVREANDRSHRWVLPHHSMVETRTQVDEAHADGLLVGVWTVNRQADARRLADYGVDAIVTDDPPFIDAEVRS